MAIDGDPDRCFGFSLATAVQSTHALTSLVPLLSIRGGGVTPISYTILRFAVPGTRYADIADIIF